MSGRKCISIDIGEKNIHLVEGVYKSGIVEIEKAFSLNTPTGSVIDGKVEDRQAVNKIIDIALKQNKVRARHLIFTIQSSAIVTWDYTLPVMDDARLKSAADTEMEQHMPVAMSFYDVEHKVVGEITADDVKMLKIKSTAVPKGLVDSYYELAVGLKLVPLALDVHYNSVSKLFKEGLSVNGENLAPEKTYALVDMGYKNTGIHVIANNKLEFSRLVPFGGRNLDTVVASNYDIDLDKASQKKQELHLSDIECVLRPLMLQHLAELQKILHYYTSRRGGDKIQTVFLYGGGASMKGLEDYAGQILNLRSVAIEDMNVVKKTKNTDIRKIGSYINAAGALIRL